MSTLPLRLWLLVLVALVVATGCAGLRQARKKVDGDVVGSVRIEGATYLQQELIRAQMGQKPSSFGVRIPVLRRLVRPVPLDETLLIDDAFRVETWLAHQGWFDARVEGWRIERRRRERLRKDGTTRRAGVVVVRGVLERGPQSVVREFDIAWQDDRSPRATQRNIEGTVGRNGYVTPGLAFNLDYAEYTRDMMLAEIRNLGHAYADVDMLVDAYPELFGAHE